LPLLAPTCPYDSAGRVSAIRLGAVLCPSPPTCPDVPILGCGAGLPPTCPDLPL